MSHESPEAPTPLWVPSPENRAFKLIKAFGGRQKKRSKESFKEGNALDFIGFQQISAPKEPTKT